MVVEESLSGTVTYHQLHIDAIDRDKEAVSQAQCQYKVFCCAQSEGFEGQDTT